MRLDNYLVQNGFVDSRNKAQTLIKGGDVKVDDEIVKKPSFDLESAKIEILTDEIYVSRAAYKLKFFLQENDVDITQKRCLDVGSSTGGFTQILLENEAQSVTCVDVGQNQLSKKIKDDIRVMPHENCNIKDFKDEPFDVVTCDVSFVSVVNILEDIDRLSFDKIIILFKPQFEVGKSVKRDKRGVVADEVAIQRAMDNFEVSAQRLDWKMINKSHSKLKGKDGNAEFFYLFSK
jgi:23S rRNA (cytidine1920-2'-O)/16S rRNA (cytidine1409-2'-O)-methyltransferase